MGLTLYTAFFCLLFQTSSNKRNCSFAFFLVLNLLVERRKDIVWRIDATSIQIEPVQSPTIQSRWGFINLQKAHNIGQEFKKITATQELPRYH